MAIYTKIIKRFYQDSLKLMRVSNEIKDTDNIEQAFAFMGTEINKKTRMQAGLLSHEAMEAGADDLILLVKSEEKDIALAALALFENKIISTEAESKKNTTEAIMPVTFEEGISALADANLAVISVPGTYAAMNAMNALRLGMNVQLFSDNVSIEEEIELKDFAKTKGLLVMGPDCGTSIISGVPICFANQVRRGNIGIVGASGTGIQELTVLIDAMGCGISHAIGTGGRDLSEKVQARTTVSAIELLANDPQTEIIVVISKPPAKASEEKVMEAIRKADKPAILLFMGNETACLSKEPIVWVAGTIEEGAAKAIAIYNSQDVSKATILYERKQLNSLLLKELGQLTKTQRYIRGLYTGGTLASEAVSILQSKGIGVYSNISKTKEFMLPTASISREHCIVDLGDDEFTRGNLHPMIDPSPRSARVMQEFSDPETAVLLCDIVIGFGSHFDPAGVLAQDIIHAREKTRANVIVIASVTGTDADPQKKQEQVRKLEDAGVWVYPSNQYAVEVAGKILNNIRN